MRKTIFRIDVAGDKALVHFTDGTHARESADMSQWMRPGQVAEVEQHVDGRFTIVRVQSPAPSKPMNLSERLERAARKTDELATEFGARSSKSQLLNEEGVATFARLSLLMFAAAEILRAARNPEEPLREEMLGERRDPI